MIDAKTVRTFRQTAAIAKIGRILFSKQALKLNPSSVVGLLRGVGLNVPQGVTVSADVAQMVIAGGALVSNASTAASIGAYAVPGAQVVQAATDLLESCGVMKAESPAAEFLTIGTDVALILASGGANVLADLKFVLDLVNLSQLGNGVADGLAQSNLHDMLKVRQSLQKEMLSRNLADFQNKKINIFDLIAKVATESPDYFSYYFPQYNAFFPSGPVELYAESSYTDLFGTHTSHAVMYVNTLKDNNFFDVVQTIWDKLAYPSIAPFTQYDQYNPHKIQSRYLALLCTLPPYPKAFKSNFNAVTLMRAFNLTPSDLGAPDLVLNVLLDREHAAEHVYDTAFTNQAVSFNGVDSLQLPTNNPYPTGAQDQKFLIADQTGDIETLMSDPDIAKAINDWATPGWSDGIQSLDARNFSNYFSMISMVDMIRNDRYIQGLQHYGLRGPTANLDFKHQIMGQTSSIPSSDLFNTMAQDLMFKVHARKMNILALSNIAYWLNTSIGNLQVLSQNPGQPTIFATPDESTKPSFFSNLFYKKPINLSQGA